MQRIMVIGNNGSGKSVFSTRLAKKLNLPVIYLDEYFHREDGSRLGDEEWEQLQKQLVKKNKKWIIDGTYLRTINIRLDAADTVIFLDLPKWLVLFRAIKRQFGNQRSILLPEKAKGKLSWRLVRKILFFPKRKIFRIVDQFKKDKNIVILRSQKDIEDFLQNPNL